MFAAGASHGLDASRQWLLTRLDRESREGLDGLLGSLVEHVGTATADAVTVRMLTTTGDQLVPLCAYHPDPETAVAIGSVMSRTADARSGLWGDVVTQRRTRRWHVAPPLAPDEASTAQAKFLGRFDIRAVLGVPLVDHEVVVGGLALFRLGVDRPYEDADQALAEDCARRIGPVVALRRSLAED